MSDLANMMTRKEVEALIEAAVLAERAACAKVCDEMGKTQFIPNHDAYIIPYKPQDCAAAIRARKEK